MRTDHDLLTLRGKKALKDYAQNLNAAILQAALIAKQNGELSACAPVEDIATLLSGIANAGPAHYLGRPQLRTARATLRWVPRHPHAGL